MGLSIVIPSKSAGNLRECLAAIRARDPLLHITVVDDGVVWGHEDATLYRQLMRVVPGVHPFIYARNCNIGIQATYPDDVLLLNDDALLETPEGFTTMWKLAKEHPEIGVMGAAIDYCGTPEQLLDRSNLRRMRQGKSTGLRELHLMVVFACVIITRRIIDQIGLLDERFGVNAGGPGKRGYGCDDDDYCWRVRQAGLKLAVYDGCLVNHTKLKSTFRSDPEHPWDVLAHEALFEEKWGRHPRSYERDIADSRMVPRGTPISTRADNRRVPGQVRS